MISQADIIKALVNKNCTDESILAMALSPDCTPPKLLEKFTEAERFDLALDLSMKLGLDVLPLWKTWALRCLKNYDFQAARDKFRHCFQRLRSSTGRASPSASKLLDDILNELCRMEENKLPLSEEIEIIKNRQASRNIIYDISNLQLSSDHIKTPNRDKTIIELKPKIYSECLNYLKDYGTKEDRVKFFLRNKLWHLTVDILLDSKLNFSPDKYFMSDVISVVSSTGHLHDLLLAFRDQDPDMSSSVHYYKAMYRYYTHNRRYNSLCYLQDTLGDYVGAAENQILHFYLRRPLKCYKELNQRISCLIEAKENYSKYLVKLKDLNLIKCESSSMLFTTVSQPEAEERIRTLETQIEITRNFAINEVQGCINSIQVVCLNNIRDDERLHTRSPVTLFDTTERRLTFLASLVLIYYDVDCAEYFSESGLRLAMHLIQDLKLDKLCVYKTAMRIIIEDESCDLLHCAELLLKRVTEDHILSYKKLSPPKMKRRPSKTLVARQVQLDGSPTSSLDPSQSSIPPPTSSKEPQQQQRNINTPRLSLPQVASKTIKPGTNDSARVLFDEIVRDTIQSCSEPDYKMTLSNLLSTESRIELYIELGKLSNAQRLACDMNRPDYVAMILKEAERLNQDHVKDVCQHWLAKH